MVILGSTDWSDGNIISRNGGMVTDILASPHPPLVGALCKESPCEREIHSIYWHFMWYTLGNTQV